MSQVLLGLSNVISLEDLGFHIRFINENEFPAGAYKGKYNYLLVVISYLFAVFASYVGIITTTLTHETRRSSQFLWQTLGMFAFGGGVWSMHFTGMTAYILPVEVHYDVLLTGLSTVPAFFAAAVVLPFLSRKKFSLARRYWATLMLASGIACMHFIGMEAMQSKHGMLYDPALFALSLIIAVMLAFIAVSAESWLRNNSRLKASGRTAITSALVGLAITAMHYTAMTSVYHIPDQPHGSSAFIVGKDVLHATMNGFVTVLLITVTAAILLKKMIEKSALFQNVFNSSTDALLIIHQNGKIMRANAQAVRVFGIAANDLLKCNIFSLLPSDCGLDLSIGSVLPKEQQISFVFRLQGPLTLEMTVTDLQNSQDEIYTLLLHDITEQKKIEERLYRQTHFNTLSGLPNRLSLVEKLEEKALYGHRFTLLFVEITNIQQVMDSLGVGAGDLLIRIAAKRLAKNISRNCSLYHLHGGQFAVIHTSTSPRALTALIERVHQSFARSFSINNEPVFGNCKMGVAFFPTDGQCAESVMSAAHSAMSQVMENGGCGYPSSQFNIQAQRNLKLETLLRHAVSKNEFNVVYQPKVNADSGRFVGAEALIRWHSDELGFVSPAEFIPLAEHTDLILPIGEWVLNQSVATIAKLRALGLRDFTIAVNISPKQFVMGDLIEQVTSCIEIHGVPANYLELEITEGVLIEAADTIAKQITRLQEMGVHIALDDFGTGYSSLSYLSNYQFDTLKIDQSFVRDLDEGNSKMALIRLICKMGQELGMKIVAEGVETSQHVSLLHREGCDIYQGYHFARPMPLADLLQWLQIESSSPAEMLGFDT